MTTPPTPPPDPYSPGNAPYGNVPPPPQQQPWGQQYQQPQPYTDPQSPAPPPGAMAAPGGPAPSPYQQQVGPPQSPTWATPSNQALLNSFPGSIPLRPLDLGDMYRAVNITIRANPGATIGIATVTNAIAQVLVITMQLLGFRALTTFDPTNPDVDVLVSTIGWTSIAALAGTGVSFLLNTIAIACVTYTMGQATSGAKISLSGVLRATRSKILPIMGLSIVIGFAIFGIFLVAVGLPVLLIAVAQEPTLALILILTIPAAFVAAIIIGVRTGFSIPVLILENTGVGAALSRGWRLSRGFAWKIIGVMLLTVLMIGVVYFVLGAVASLIAGLISASASTDVYGSLVASTISSGIVNVLLGGIALVIQTGVLTMLYVDARIRREGLDMALIQSNSAQTSPY